MIGKKLKELRNKKGISQEETAKYLNLSTARYGQYEVDKRNPDYTTLLKLAEFFGVTTDSLLGVSTTTVDEDGITFGSNFGLTQDELKEAAELFKLYKGKL